MSSKSMVSIGNMVIDLSQNSLSYKDQDTYLGPLRAHLLGYLCQNVNQVVSREELSNAVWGRVVSDHTINQHISQLRKILQAAENDELTIATIPKKGYIVRSENAVTSGNGANGGQLAPSKVLVLESSESQYQAFADLQEHGCLSNYWLAKSVDAFKVQAMSGEYDAAVIDVDVNTSANLQLIKDIRMGLTALSADIPLLVMAGQRAHNYVGFNVLADVQAMVAKPVEFEVMSKQIQQALQCNLKLKPSAAYALIPTTLLDDSEHDPLPKVALAN